MAAQHQAAQKAAILPAVLILSSAERLGVPFFLLVLLVQITSNRVQIKASRSNCLVELPYGIYVIYRVYVI
jgi:hypothetical protein